MKTSAKFYVWQDSWHWWWIALGREKKCVAIHGHGSSYSGDYNGQRWVKETPGSAQKFGRGFQFLEAALDALIAYVGEDLKRDEIDVRNFKRKPRARMPFCRIHQSRDAGTLAATETKDCTVVAFKQVTGLTYEQAHAIFKRAGRQERKGFYPGSVLDNPRTGMETLSATGHSHGFQFTPICCKSDQRIAGEMPAYRSWHVTLGKFLERHPIGTFYVCTNSHAFAIYDGMVFDYSAKCSTARIREAWAVGKVSVK